MRPTTPNLRVSQSVGPSSPPQTPKTSSPAFHRTMAAKLQGPNAQPFPTPPMAVPVPNLSFARPIRPEELSPQSSGSSAASASSESDESSADSPPRSIASEPRAPHPRTTRVVTQASFVVEEMSDFGGSADDAHVEVIRPHAIEYADSDRSRSRSRSRPERGPSVDPKMVHNFGNLNCSDDSDNSDIDMDELEYQRFILKRREDKRRRRMTSGSIGKRTISESIGSDSDREDVQSFLDVNEVGSSARRLRRRVGDRRSLQFQDPPPPRIEELEEPPTSDDELLDGETFARELPYYTLEYISMEIDSP